MEVELIHGNENTIVTTDYYGKELTQLLSFFGSYDLKSEHWSIPNKNKTNVKNILTLFKRSLKKYGPGSDEFKKETESLYLTASIMKLSETLPIPLYDHQIKAIPRIISQEGFLLADDMGLGKSITSLAVIHYLFKHNNFNKVLIFCQKRAIKQWFKYSQKFTPDLELTIVDGIASKRSEIWKSNKSIYVTNLEKIINDFKHIIGINWDFIILDEASYFIRNPESKRSKYIKKLKSNKRLALTGTPIENTLVDLYSLFVWLYPDFFESYYHFEKEYIVCVKQRIPMYRWRNGKKIVETKEFKKIVGYKNIDKLKRMIAPYFIRRTEKDIGLDLPNIISENFIIPMLKDQERVYKSLVNGIKKQKVINTEFNKIKLLRSCDNSHFAEPSTNSSNKIETLLELIRENSHRKIIVFSQWADMIVSIHLTLNLENMDHAVVVGSGSKHKFDFKIIDEEQFDKFKNDCNILIATDAISRSQDFPYASVVINVDLPWNPATIDQRIKRIRRLASKHKHVFSFNIVSQNSIEETVLPVLENKIKLSKTIIDNNEYSEMDFDLEKILRGVI